MSVVINTNFAATLAANNLAASNGMLQKSLNRLSSGSKIVNPADDAGGLAVSMKLSATAKRQGAAASNLGNSVSFLQAQDGVMKAAGKVLERIGELKTLASDPTKNSSDLANYNEEFVALQAQLTSLGSEKFNGIDLFGSATMSVGASADANGSTIAVGGVNLLDAPAFSPFTDDFDDFSNWTALSGSPGVSSNTLYPADSVRTNQSFSGPMEINFDLYISGSFDSVDLSLGSDTLSSLMDGVNASKWAWHSVKIVFDGTGNASSYLDGSNSAADTQSGIGATSGQIKIDNSGAGSSLIRNFSVESTETAGNTYSVTDATDLQSLSLTTITSALQDVATFRATNGAQQARLGFAAEVLATNKANVEAANSRIIDVDVAEESTQLARYNILVQAGTAMLGQANQSAQSALRLIG